MYKLDADVQIRTYQMYKYKLGVELQISIN